MALRIRDKKDFNAGLMFMLIGGFFVVIALGVPGVASLPGYSMGTAVRMGPAYFPTILGALCAILGLITFVRSFFFDGDPPPAVNWRPMAFILGAVVAFAALVGTAGVIIATMAIVLLAAFGGHEFYWKEQLIDAVVLTIATVSIFYYGLGLPFKLWPWSF